MKGNPDANEILEQANKLCKNEHLHRIARTGEPWKTTCDGDGNMLCQY
ncbi:MAG: hypothetical protein MR294_02755 [Bacteroidales bacterium]|nr:hypothetical protein [Bacteroidales bacterium]